MASSPANNLVVFGTRPEEIKLWPLTAYPGYTFLRVNQSKDLHQQLIPPDRDCEEEALPLALDLVKPRRVIVQGDTRTAFRAALLAFEREIPVVHIEAGLRTWDLSQPFPEEGYRRMIDVISSYHFCPTLEAVLSLPWTSALMVGQTSIDTLLAFAPKRPRMGNTVICTVHRREADVENIAMGLNTLANSYPAYRFIYARHPNQTSTRMTELLDVGTWTIIEPLPYREFVLLLANCHSVLTDSGGLQEEAPALGKPVLVLRDTTERQEGVDAGCAILGGMTEPMIVEGFRELLDRYREMKVAKNPYGDGKAGEKIHAALS